MAALARHFQRGQRLEYVALFLFAAVFIALDLLTGPLKAALAAFAASSLFYSLSVAIALQNCAAPDLPRLSARHDRSARFILVTGLILDLSAIGVLLVFLSSREIDLIALALTALSIFGAWMLMNMLFAVHYAHAFFINPDDDYEPLEFPGKAARQFSDFVYFSFVIGMTFQVSDVAIIDAGLRRLATAHAVIAFFFNVFVIALAVNSLGNLF